MKLSYILVLGAGIVIGALAQSDFEEYSAPAEEVAVNGIDSQPAAKPALTPLAQELLAERQKGYDARKRAEDLHKQELQQKVQAGAATIKLADHLSALKSAATDGNATVEIKTYAIPSPSGWTSCVEVGTGSRIGSRCTVRGGPSDGLQEYYEALADAVTDQWGVKVSMTHTCGDNGKACEVTLSAKLPMPEDKNFMRSTSVNWGN